MSTQEGVARFVPVVADLVQRYGEPFLRGDDEFFDRIEASDRQASARLQARWRAEESRKEAEAARLSKDLPAMVRAYESIERELTELEKKRLAYARSKLGKAR